MKGTSSCCQAGQVHPLGRRPCLVDRHVQPPRGGTYQCSRVTGHQQRRRAPRGQRARRRGAVGAGSNRRAHVSGASSTQGAGPRHRRGGALRFPVHRRSPGMAPGRAGNARGHHRAPRRRPLMGEGGRQAVGSRRLVLQRPGATGGRRDQRPRQIPAYALTVLEYVSLAFRFRLDRRLRSAVGPKRTGRIVRICVIRECPPRTVAYTPPLATGHFSPRFRCPPPSPPRQPRAGGGYRYCRGCGRLVSTDTLPLARCRSVSGSSAGSSVASMRAGNACSHHRAPPRKTAPGPPGARPGRRGHTTRLRRCAQGPDLGDSHTVTNRSRAPGQVPHKTSHSGGAGQVDRRPRAAGKRATGRRPPCRRTTHATSSQQPAPRSATRRAGRRAAQPTGDCRWGSGFSSPLWAPAWRQPSWSVPGCMMSSYEYRSGAARRVASEQRRCMSRGRARRAAARVA